MRVGDKITLHPASLSRRFDTQARRGKAEGHIVRSHQGTSLDTLLEAAILEKVERVAEALTSGGELWMLRRRRTS